MENMRYFRTEISAIYTERTLLWLKPWWETGTFLAFCWDRLLAARFQESNWLLRWSYGHANCNACTLRRCVCYCVCMSACVIQHGSVAITSPAAHCRILLQVDAMMYHRPVIGLRMFPGKSLSRKDVSRKIIFPEKIVCHCFNVKQTLIVFCVNWRIILRTGLLSLIREVMRRDPALLVFTMSALRGQVPAHHVGPYNNLLTASNVK